MARTSGDSGWVCLWRKFQTWQWKHKPEMVALWIDLLLRANHAPHKFENTIIQRGQCVVGLPKLVESTGLSAQRVRTCLKRLKSTNEITSKSTNKFSIITLLNYSHYQDLSTPNQQANQQANQQTTNIQSTFNQQQTTMEQLNNENNLCIGGSDEPTPKIKRRIKKPELEWQAPSLEELQALKEQFGSTVVDREIPKCKDHFAHKDGLSRDWPARRRNWMRKALEFAGRKSGNWIDKPKGKMTTFQRNKDMLKAALMEEIKNGNGASESSECLDSIPDEKVLGLPFSGIRQGNN